MPSLIQVLGATAATRWRPPLWGEGPGGRAKPKVHRVHKEGYDTAVVECLAAGEPGALPKWTEVVDRVPHGARATFYSVAGPKATYPLLREYVEGTDQQREIAARYQRGD